MDKEEFLEKVKKFYMTPAKDIMNKKFPTIKFNESISNVMNEISKQAVDHLWVVDDDNKVVGIITEKDLLDAMKKPLFGEDLAWDALEKKSLLYRDIETADCLMTPRLFTCESDTDLKRIVKVMVDNRIRHLPVIEDGSPIGEITIDPIIKLVNKNFFE